MGAREVIEHIGVYARCHDLQRLDETRSRPVEEGVAVGDVDARMWADDRLWFPLMLAGQSFQGRFLFDGDILLGHHVTIQP